VVSTTKEKMLNTQVSENRLQELKEEEEIEEKNKEKQKEEAK